MPPGARSPSPPARARAQADEDVDDEGDRAEDQAPRAPGRLLAPEYVFKQMLNRNAAAAAAAGLAVSWAERWVNSFVARIN